MIFTKSAVLRHVIMDLGSAEMERHMTWVSEYGTHHHEGERGSQELDVDEGSHERQERATCEERGGGIFRHVAVS